MTSFCKPSLTCTEVVHKSGQASTREPADSDLQGEAFMDPALVNGRRVDFHVFDMAGSIGADVMITDPAAPSYVQRGWDESRLLRECERAKREKHVLNGATMIPLLDCALGVFPCYFLFGCKDIP